MPILNKIQNGYYVNAKQEMAKHTKHRWQWIGVSGFALMCAYLIRRCYSNNNATKADMVAVAHTQPLLHHKISLKHTPALSHTVKNAPSLSDSNASLQRKYTQSLSIKPAIQHQSDVMCVDMCYDENRTSAVLVVGDAGGWIWIYEAPLANTHLIRFKLRYRVPLMSTAERIDWEVNAVHFCPLSVHEQKYAFLMGFHERVGAHSSVLQSFDCDDMFDENLPHLVFAFLDAKLRFLGASDRNVGVWKIEEMKSGNCAHLIASLTHPETVYCAKYSSSGMILTGCDDGVIRLYDPEPLFSLRWKFKGQGNGRVTVESVAFSPSNRIAASFRFRQNVQINFVTEHSAKYCSFMVQVWDSSFRTLFKYEPKRVNLKLTFASNEVLVACGHGTVVWYNVSNSYSEVKYSDYPTTALAVAKLHGGFVAVSYSADELHVYKVDGNQVYLLRRFPLGVCKCLASLLHSGIDAGFVLACVPWLDSENIIICHTDDMQNGKSGRRIAKRVDGTQNKGTFL